MIRWVRSNAAQIVIGAVLIAGISTAVFVWVPYQREQRIVRTIEARGGRAECRSLLPKSIPQSIRGRLPFLERVRDVYFPMKNTDDGLEHLHGLSHLESLDLRLTIVTDAGLERLKGLKSLKSLELSHAKVTDAGVHFLKEITSLEILHLGNTQVTGSGLEHLKI